MCVWFSSALLFASQHTDGSYDFMVPSVNVPAFTKPVKMMQKMQKVSSVLLLSSLTSAVSCLAPTAASSAVAPGLVGCFGGRQGEGAAASDAPWRTTGACADSISGSCVDGLKCCGSHLKASVSCCSEVGVT